MLQFDIRAVEAKAVQVKAELSWLPGSCRAMLLFDDENPSLHELLGGGADQHAQRRVWIIKPFAHALTVEKSRSRCYQPGNIGINTLAALYPKPRHERSQNKNG